MKTSFRRLILAGLLLSVACGGPPKTGLDRLYRGLAEPLPRIDVSTLANRRILIDPGHGGLFRGTVGRDSLEESSVNLGVALYLWGLLREAGADVYLTRSIDRDFLSESDSSLASDLRRRVVIADSLQPDVLLSIHHNAQPARDPESNSVETYYRAGDPASMNLAFAVHRHLMRNLGIEDGEVRQGNYLILRESEAPAVLGESSYLTHPPVEKKLRLSEIQKLEAEAYFLGLLDYFNRGIPRIHDAAPGDSAYASIPTLTFMVEDDGGSGIDPDGVGMTVDGRSVAPVVDASARRVLYHPPWDLPNGPHELAVSARNLGGNTSSLLRKRFTVDYPPEIVIFDTMPEHLPASGGVFRVRARLLDRRGLVVREGTAATWSASNSETATRAAVVGGAVEASFVVGNGTSSLVLGLECRGRRFEKTVTSEPNAPAQEAEVFTFVLVDASTRRPIFDATVLTRDSIVQQGAPLGRYYYRREARDEDALSETRIQAPGYQPLAAPESMSDTLEMTPWFDGILAGKRFVVDPEGGRSAGPLGLAGSYASLQVAEYLAGFLRDGGARVWLTRSNEELRTPEDIARLTNRYGADLYLEIRHGAENPDSGLAVTTYHFPGSRKGSLAARAVLAAMSRRLGLPARGPYEQVTFPLQQTACPAIIVEPPSLSSVEEELRLAESWYQREQAYSVFLGILDHYAAPAAGTAVIVVDDVEPSRWRVTVDGTWTLVTGPVGRVAFDALSAGDHRVTVQKAQAFWQGQFRLSPGETVEIRAASTN